MTKILRTIFFAAILCATAFSFGDATFPNEDASPKSLRSKVSKDPNLNPVKKKKKSVAAKIPNVVTVMEKNDDATPVYDNAISNEDASPKSSRSKVSKDPNLNPVTKKKKKKKIVPTKISNVVPAMEKNDDATPVYDNAFPNEDASPKSLRSKISKDPNLNPVTKKKKVVSTKIPHVVPVMEKEKEDKVTATKDNVKKTSSDHEVTAKVAKTNKKQTVGVKKAGVKKAGVKKAGVKKVGVKKGGAKKGGFKNVSGKVIHNTKKKKKKQSIVIPQKQTSPGSLEPTTTLVSDYADYSKGDTDSGNEKEGLLLDDNENNSGIMISSPGSLEPTKTLVSDYADYSKGDTDSGNEKKGLLLDDNENNSGIMISAKSNIVSTAATEPTSPTIIKDDRVRTLDINPVLGRGYSVETNNYQSTCLEVSNSESSVPVFDYKFIDLSSSVDAEADLSASLSASFGFWKVKAELDISAKSSSKFRRRTHTIIASMRAERYYSNSDEGTTSLTGDATALLQGKDYVGFFKSCGPQYVKGIRRAQELTTIFKFHSSSQELASEFAKTLKVSGFGQKIETKSSRKSKFSSINNSLEIKIQGYGLALNIEGSDALVATSLDGYNDALEYAYNSMTQTEANNDVGMIYETEVVPWVDNAAFKAASGLLNMIEIPVARNLIPKAVSDTAVFSNDAVTRSQFTCEFPSDDPQIDKYGYCCEGDELYNPETGEYEPEPESDPAGPSQRVCKPTETLDPSVAKNNMLLNGEFVVRLDSVVQSRLNQFFNLEKCITDVRAIPDSYEYYFLKSQDAVKYDATLENSYTVAELKMALDPTGDYGFVRHMSHEMDEFDDMFYKPCLAALFGNSIGNSNPQYFMAKKWTDHPVCNHLSCLENDKRWDREGSLGCVDGLITGDSPNYSGSFCKKDEDDYGEEESCKYPEAELDKYRSDALNCWSQESRFSINPKYLMEHFCLPGFTTSAIVVADGARQTELSNRKSICNAGDPSVTAAF